MKPSIPENPSSKNEQIMSNVFVGERERNLSNARILWSVNPSGKYERYKALPRAYCRLVISSGNWYGCKQIDVLQANEKRDWRIFQDFGLKLIDQSEDSATAKYSLF
jgi:hypothetical protein